MNGKVKHEILTCYLWEVSSSDYYVINEAHHPSQYAISIPVQPTNRNCFIRLLPLTSSVRCVSKDSFVGNQNDKCIGQWHTFTCLCFLLSFPLLKEKGFLLSDFAWLLPPVSPRVIAKLLPCILHLLGR